MKSKTLVLVAAGLLIAGQAQAIPQLVAGWDFSQSCLEGNLCDQSYNPIQTLPANYSDLDPTSGMGLESAAFGTMLLDGTLGSSDVPGYGGWFTTVSPDLALNRNNHTNFPLVEMSALGNASVMQAEIPGINYQEHAMRASDAVDVVFAVDLTSLGAGWVGSNFDLSFAALSEGSSTVEVSFWDGMEYDLLVTEALGGAEEVVHVALGGVNLSQAYVKLHFDAGELSRIDNLAIKADLVPEPGTVLLLGLGLGGLAIFGRRRS